jgi:NAD(P)H-flavin reductase
MKPDSLEEISGSVYPATLLRRRRLSDKTLEIELAKPPAFDFKPGQRIRFVHQSMERD